METRPNNTKTTPKGVVFVIAATHDKLTNMNIRYIYAIIGALLILVAGIWWVQANKVSDAPAEAVATSTEPIATSTPSSSNTSVQPVAQQQPTSPTPVPFALISGETVASWDFSGTHKDGGQLEAKVRADITRLKGLINSGTYTNYELYVSIANQYELLGDGKQEFTYLNYALAIDSTKTGLAWHNMGKLLERLGAYKSARVAYDRMVATQPTAQYIRARLEFLQAHMPEDTDAIAQAEADLAASTW